MSALPAGFKKMYFGFCVYDILGLGPLALPFLASPHIATMDIANSFLGGTPWATFDPVGLAFAQLLGLLGIAWAVFRFRNPRTQVAIYEGWLRLLFAGNFAYFAVTLGAPVFWVFALIDVISGIAHLFAYRIPAASN